MQARFGSAVPPDRSIFTIRCASDNANAENEPRWASRHRSVLFREYMSCRSCNRFLYEDLRDAGNKLRVIEQVFYQKCRSHVRQGIKYVARHRKLYRANDSGPFRVNVARISNEYRENNIDQGKILVGNYRIIGKMRELSVARRGSFANFRKFRVIVLPAIKRRISRMLWLIDDLQDLIFVLCSRYVNVTFGGSSALDR